MGGFIGGGGARVLASEGGVYAYNNSAAETTVGSVIVPAGIPGNNGILLVQYCCSINYSGAAAPFTFGWYLEEPDGLEFSSAFYDIDDLGVTLETNYVLTFQREIQGLMNASGVMEYLGTDSVRLQTRTSDTVSQPFETVGYSALTPAPTSDGVIGDLNSTFRFVTQFDAADPSSAVAEVYCRAVKVC